jgi:hypothetical protein
VELLFCRICKNRMELPTDAVFISSSYRSPYKMYRFWDGSIHDLIPAASVDRKASSFRGTGSNGNGLHLRWHVNRGIKKEGCSFCFSEETHGSEEDPEIVESQKPILNTAYAVEEK